MTTTFKSKLLKELYELTGEIGCKAEENYAYDGIYKKLAEALDIAEELKLIDYTTNHNKEK